MSCGSNPNGGIQSRIYVALLVLIAAPFARAEPADIVFLHGRIHTQDAKGHVVEALAVIRNDIAAVGNDRKIRRFTGPHTRIIDLDGKTVLPGFIDAHTHPAESAQELGKCGLDDAPLDLRTVQAKVAVCLAQNPGVPPEWFEVVQVNPSGLILSRRNLDAMLADRPMLFSGSDGHTVWVNTEALRAAGISSATPDPPGGRIERDSSGNPTGTLRDNATELALQKMPRPSIETEANRLAHALGAMRADGITSVQDASVDAHLMSIYKFLYDKHQLLMRVRGCYHLVNLKADPASLIEEAKRFRAAWGIDREYLRADSVKIFADGVVEYPTQTASLLTPYLDAAGHATANRGPSYFTQSNLNGIVARADAAGFTVHVHAIGDRATRAALDAFSFARVTNGSRDNRHQIAHLELVDREDFPRFKPLGVIANFQLEWAERDDYVTRATLPYIGPERATELYPARSLRDAGAFIVGGSDWNVSTFNPFVAMEHAITRAAAKGQPPLLPEQAVTLQDMVDAYTIHAAYALKAETYTGSLEVGKHADLIVLDRDIFDIDPYELHDTKIDATYLDGHEVYRRSTAMQ